MWLCMRLCMRLCVNNRTADEAVYEQHDCAWGHVWTAMLCMWNKWKFKGKMERCNRTMMTKKEQRKKIVTHNLPINFKSHQNNSNPAISQNHLLALVLPSPTKLCIDTCISYSPWVVCICICLCITAHRMLGVSFISDAPKALVLVTI